MASEYTIDSPPGDPVSSLAFNPNASKGTELLVASWDKTVRLYRLPQDCTADSAQKVELVHSFSHEAAVLDVCWISDTLAASASLDRRVRLLNLATGQTNIIGKHANAVSRIRFSRETGLLISASWDASLKVWDPSAEDDGPRLRKTVTLPEKALAMDICPPFPQATSLAQSIIPESGSRLVVGMTGRLVYIYDLHEWGKVLKGTMDEKTNNAGEETWKPQQKRESSLKFMLRDIRCMPNGSGYATSSIDGRIAVDFFDSSEAGQAQKYAFKCHRQVVDGVDTVYPVNTIAFHPQHGTFASLGGDSVLSIWDAAAKKRIRQYPRFPSPLSTGALSSNGLLLAVASGFENLEETRHTGAAPGEVGGIGAGGEGRVQIHIRTAWEDFKPKAK